MASERHAPGTWLQLRFTCDAATAEALAGQLDACGALSVSLDDAEDQPIYEPPPGATPLWPSTRVSGLFAGDRDADELLAELGRRLAPRALPAPRVERLPDREWTRLHREAFAPACFGGRLWIVPSWAAPPPLDPGQVTMRMDPGLAFGTGSHATTAMCLDWLAGESLADRDVLDYGCGSGVLAIAAAKLGARRVWAVDIDPQALTATRDNAAENQVGSCVQVCDAGDLPPLTVHLLVSNILANTLSALAQTLCAAVRPGGRMALAGLLRGQSSDVIARFAPWCALRPVAEREDWVLLAGARGKAGA